MKLRILPQAQRQIASIVDHIAVASPLRAVAFSRALTAACQDLCSMPRAFPLVPDYEDRGIRKRPHGRYLIFYRVAGAHVEVLHVIHGARDYAPLLSSERPSDP
jgi:plasmid stabilization system protein ParE